MRIGCFALPAMLLLAGVVGLICSALFGMAGLLLSIPIAMAMGWYTVEIERRLDR